MHDNAFCNDDLLCFINPANPFPPPFYLFHSFVIFSIQGNPKAWYFQIQWIVVVNNHDLNIDHNNCDYDFCHNQAAQTHSDQYYWLTADLPNPAKSHSIIYTNTKFYSIIFLSSFTAVFRVLRWCITKMYNKLWTSTGLFILKDASKKLLMHLDAST